jgi:hypothetical protein
VAMFLALQIMSMTSSSDEVVSLQTHWYDSIYSRV